MGGLFLLLYTILAGGGLKELGVTHPLGIFFFLLNELVGLVTHNILSPHVLIFRVFPHM